MFSEKHHHLFLFLFLGEFCTLLDHMSCWFTVFLAAGSAEDDALGLMPRLEATDGVDEGGGG
jgi:hypothetical protein